jgi:hypothetical protein
MAASGLIVAGMQGSRKGARPAPPLPAHGSRPGSFPSRHFRTRGDSERRAARGRGRLR